MSPLGLYGVHLVAPGATLQLISRTRRQVVDAATRGAQRLGLRQPTTRYVTAHDTLSAQSTDTATVSVTAQRAGGPPPGLPERMRRLEQRLADVSQRLDQTRQEAAAARAEQREALDQVVDGLEVQQRNLQRRPEVAEQAALEVHNRALPVVGAGLFFAGTSQELQNWPVVAAVLVVGALAATVRAARDAGRTRAA